MERDQLTLKIQAYLDGELDEREHKEFEEALEKHKDLKQEVETFKRLEHKLAGLPESSPTPFAKTRFKSALEAELQSSGRNDRRSVWFQIAAAIALLMTGLAAGLLLKNDTVDSSQLAALQQELAATQQLVLQSKLRTQSASDRIRAVNMAATKSPDPALIKTLVSTLNTDESPNVRLAAAEALGHFAANDTVRAALVKSFEFQSDPIVQITLIQMMVELEEKSAINALQQLKNDENALESVRKNAETGIQLLI